MLLVIYNVDYVLLQLLCSTFLIQLLLIFSTKRKEGFSDCIQIGIEVSKHLKRKHTYNYCIHRFSVQHMIVKQSLEFSLELVVW